MTNKFGYMEDLVVEPKKLLNPVLSPELRKGFVKALLEVGPSGSLGTIEVRMLIPITPSMVTDCRNLIKMFGGPVIEGEQLNNSVILSRYMLQNAVDHADGNNKALLNIPLELRSLVDPKGYED